MHGARKVRAVGENARRGKRLRVGQSEEEVSDGSRPYVPKWPYVTKGSNLSTTEEKLEWL